MPSRHASDLIHVLHVVRSGSATGGMEAGIIKATDRLPLDEFRISLCALDRQETFSKYVRRPGFKAYLLPPPEGSGVDWTWPLRLARLFRSEAVDVVHAHTWGTMLHAALAAQLAGRVLIHGEHGYWMADLKPESPLRRSVKHGCGCLASRFLTVSEELRDRWVNHYGIPETRLLHIPNGVDAERFRPLNPGEESPRPLFGLPTDSFLVGSVGRLEPIKNYPALLHAAARLVPKIGNLAVAFLGVGTMEAELKDLAAKLNITDRVFFAGFRTDVPEFYRCLDVFVLLSFREGMSNALIEAMASGIPIIASAIPGNREVLTPDSGMLLESCNEDSLSTAIADLWARNHLRKEFAAKARARVCERYTLENWVNAHRRVYADVFRSQM